MKRTPQRRDTSERRVGLARALSKLGYSSRAQAVNLVRTGRVRLNGRVQRDPESPVLLGRARIEVNSQPVTRTAVVYMMLNKPRAVVTTRSDEKGRSTVYDFLPPNLPWLAPVGRLDKATEGLLLLTNDSEWAARITAPKSHLPKTYHVQIAGNADAELLRALEAGIREGDDFLRARSARVLRRGQRNSWLEIVLEEGKNRHIRRLLAALDREVLRLIRVAIGPLAMGDLGKGHCRRLTASEVHSLAHGALRPR